jgi:hypothetical protein
MENLITDEFKSVDIGRFALKMALTQNRLEETALKEELKKMEVSSVAVDFGGQFLNMIPKLLEHAVVAAKRQNVVKDDHVGEGAVIGATHEVLQLMELKAFGLSVGGKIGIARYKEHLCVAIYMGLGLLSFNEVEVGIAHRSLPL